MSEFDPAQKKIKGTPECVESQEWTYGIDNTGTSPIDENTIEVTLSDGSSFTFIQPPQAAANSWTPQMQVWGSEIQAAADAAGLAWFVETRFRDPNNPSNLAGGGGFAGPPSVAVSNALKNMFWRYVNIQICPGQPVPVSAVIIDSSNPARIGYNLSSDGAVLGPIQKFIICRSCGEAPVWYLEDGVTLASEGQIPNCYEPCGTLALTDSPPDRDCTFQTELACDSNNSTITADFTPDITRRATICNGEQISVDYFQADPSDPSALIPYTLVGRFVDCATGEEIPTPVPECAEFEITKLFTLIGDDLNGTLVNREWQDTQPSTPLFSDPVVATAEGRRIRDAHDFSLPTSNSGTQNTLALNDSDNTPSELSIQVLDGFIEVEQGGWYRYAGSSEGYWAVELGECCGPLKDVAESGGFSPTRAMEFYLPKGFHQIRLWNVDSGGSNSSATFGYSPDGGVTYINDNTPPNVSFGSAKIVEECVTVKVCEDSGAIFNLLTGDLLDPAELYTCSRLCTAFCGDNGDGDGGGSGEVFDGNVTDVTPNPDQTHTLVSGTGNVPAGLKTVTINNITGTTTINGGFALGQGRRVDSISFDATEIDRARGLLPAMTLSGGTWQWIGLQPIAEA